MDFLIGISYICLLICIFILSKTCNYFKDSFELERIAFCELINDLKVVESVIIKEIEDRQKKNLKGNNLGKRFCKREVTALIERWELKW